MEVERELLLTEGAYTPCHLPLTTPCQKHKDPEPEPCDFLLVNSSSCFKDGGQKGQAPVGFREGTRGVSECLTVLVLALTLTYPPPGLLEGHPNL